MTFKGVFEGNKNRSCADINYDLHLQWKYTCNPLESVIFHFADNVKLFVSQTSVFPAHLSSQSAQTSFASVINLFLSDLTLNKLQNKQCSWKNIKKKSFFLNEVSRRQQAHEILPSMQKVNQVVLDDRLKSTSAECLPTIICQTHIDKRPFTYA